MRGGKGRKSLNYPEEVNVLKQTKNVNIRRLVKRTKGNDE